MTEQIVIHGARLHNLKHISLNIPKNQLVVLTGPSGSGKSTLGLDILFKEGQRQYLEALGLLPFELSRAPVDAISGLSPTVSVDQKLSNRSPRSTVGTASEVYTYLRVLFARLGQRTCLNCGKIVPSGFNAAGAAWEGQTDLDNAVDAPQSFFPCPHCQTPIPVLEMAHFSFNKPAGACKICTGLGVLQQVDLDRLVDEDKSLLDGAVAGMEGRYGEYITGVLKTASRHYGIDIDPGSPIRSFTPAQRDLLFHGTGSTQLQRHFPHIEPPKTVRQGRFEGIVPNLLRRISEAPQDSTHTRKLGGYLVLQTCPECAGTRLNPESREVRVGGSTISDLTCLPLTELASWLEHLPEVLDQEEAVISEPLLFDLNMRIKRLIDVGAGYLTLERSSISLSQGETQRLRLASLLGSALSGLLCIFDEPTIGTHPRDTRKLIEILRGLRDLGNTVLVIEHDLEMIAAADYVIDFGPGGGKQGGQVVAAGTPAEISRHPGSPTGAYLSGRASIPLPGQRRDPGEHAITIDGARHHNLKNVTVRFPLGMLVAVTGVSGSGKSSLVFDILDRAARRRFYGSGEIPGEHDRIDGLEHLDKIISVDQEQIGRMPRSNTATYADIFTPIRTAFSSTREAQELDLSARHFSFNTPGGRCERCEGMGSLMVQMHFLPDAQVVCPACRGRRYQQQVLAVKYKTVNIAEVLELTVEEAKEIFQDIPAARSRLELMVEIGLGYLQLGQPTASLSGGEAQRLKLSKELGRQANRNCLYLLDEPTGGLHSVDIARLLAVLRRLVDEGSSVVVIEHNLELIKTADWVIDLGPEGGAAGGQVIAQGTPEQIAQTPGSFTGQYLREFLIK